MDSVNSFSFEGKGVRAGKRNDAPWFVAKDLCEILELGNVGQAISTLDPDEKAVVNHRELVEMGISNRDDLGITRLALVTESGLYALIFKSTKPEAKRFKKWVTSEVLPSIRKTGSYQIQVPKTFAEALALAAEQAKALECKEQEIATLEPKAEYHDKVADANGCHSMVEAAQILGTGQNRLFVALRKLGYIIQGSTRPYQTYVDDGLFKVVERIFEDAHGIDRISSKTLVTGKGMVAIQKKLRAAGLLIGSRLNGSAA